MSIIAKLWADQIKEGKKTFNDVPRLLKEKVKQILIKEKREDLLTS